MAVITQALPENILCIRVSGRFDFSVHREFREAYRECDPAMTYRVDLRDAQYMDSSALGMLLLLHEHAGGQAGRITLEVGSEDIRKVLSIAKFDRLFHIEG